MLAASTRYEQGGLGDFAHELTHNMRGDGCCTKQVCVSAWALGLLRCMASLIIEEEDGGQMCIHVYSMHNTHLHTRDKSWRTVDDDDHDDQDTTSTTSPAFEV